MASKVEPRVEAPTLAPELHKTITNIRPCLIGGGKHKSKSSPASSGGRRWEVWWRPKSLPDDHANWCKRSTRVRGVNPPKESKNGPVA
jgi:hypothetical protein